MLKKCLPEGLTQATGLSIQQSGGKLPINLFGNGIEIDRDVAMVAREVIHYRLQGMALAIATQGNIVA